MVYLVEPEGVFGNKGCKGVVYPLYGTPCYEFCRLLCALFNPCPALG
jgi:hypothetical protein